MKSVITGLICATIIGTLAGVILDTKFQESVSDRFATSGVRL